MMTFRALVRSGLSALPVLLLWLGAGSPALRAQEAPADPPPASTDEASKVGPRFQAFLDVNPGFAALFREKRYKEAAKILDRRAKKHPEDAEIRLARSYLLLEQGRPEEAQEALADRALAAGSHTDGPITRPERISGSSQMTRRTPDGKPGTVIIELLIDEQGNVQDVRLFKGLHPDLDQAALEAARTWKFKPATRDGKPFKIYYTMTVNFR